MNTAIKWIVVALLVLHGLIHVMGFLKEWRLADIKELTDQTIVPLSETTSRLLGVAWLVACVLLLAAAVALLLHRDKWWVLALFGVGLSQVLIVLWWKDARFGTVANILLIAAVLLRVLSRRSIL